MNVFDELKARGIIAQCTNEEEIRKQLEAGPVRFYVGFDPTADSLHIGHFIPIILMSHLQKAGHVPIALFGGGTGVIGDPSGKSDMRKMLTMDDIKHNVECFKNQMSRLIDFSDGKAIAVNNADWLLDLNYIDFIKKVGVHFTISKMLSAECYKQRMERGLTFFELNYMLMQSYDFYVLNQEYGCMMELGGDDQWSNMIGGVELIRRIAAKEAEETGNPVPESTKVNAFTCSLLLTSEGKKMGKTEKGALWLDPNKTSPYDFYQYWRNIDDADVIKCLKMLTFLPLDYIDELAKAEGSEINKVKEVLAFEVTKLIHGEEEAEKAQATARALFTTGGDIENMPSTELTSDDFTDGKITVQDILVKCKLCPSKGEAKRLIQQGGVLVDDVKVTDMFATLTEEDFSKGYVVIKKGKKVFHKATFNK
ncbi:MAG: tyrosine--tRNA ligase [Ruminococcaceae bacterium]|nr:tyrosine--tRNA ligase [Oscillospiraceae bacterium]